MKHINQLTLEQQFKIATYMNKIHEFNKDQTKKYLVSILKKMMVKDNVIKYCIKNSIN